MNAFNGTAGNHVFHIIVDAEPAQLSTIEVALELIMSRPDRWHSGLTGLTSPFVITDNAGLLLDWASRHQLTVLSRCRVEDIAACLVASRSRRLLPTIGFYLQIGIPVLTINPETMDIEPLGQDEIWEWFMGATDSQHKFDIQRPISKGNRGHFMRSEDIQFRQGFDMILGDAVSEPPLGPKDGDQCRFTRSRVEKAG